MAIQLQPPATPSPSATLILARKNETDLEIYLLRRNDASKFLPGTYVFPGGALKVDDLDTVFWKNHMDLPVNQLAGVLDGKTDRMLPFAVAAIRETWEEAGLLLAVPEEGGADIEPGESESIPFSQWIRGHGLRLAVSKLGRWHHWITPELMPRRFDTFFFVSAVGPNQNCRPDNIETVHGTWINPRKALEDNMRGILPLSPPTFVTLHQMLSFTDVDGLVAETRSRTWPAPITPRLWPFDNSALIITPWDPDYTRDTVCVDIDRLEQEILPVGVPFSRLWRQGGICRPVRHPDEY
jgi:8-oxo-dGTP pyrophosphatase MutT (NUDIX family)